MVKFNELRVKRYNFQALFLMNLILRNSSRLRFASSTFVTFVDTLSSFPHLECDEIFDPLFVNASKSVLGNLQSVFFQVICCIFIYRKYFLEKITNLHLFQVSGLKNVTAV